MITLNAAVLSVSLLSLTLFCSIVLFFPYRSNGSSSVGGRDSVRGGRQPSSPSRVHAGRGFSKWWERWSSTNPGRDYRWDRKRDRGRRGVGTRNLDQTDGLHHVLCGICCRLGQRMAVPVPLLQERWRWASETLCRDMLGCCIESLWIHKLTKHKTVTVSPRCDPSLLFAVRPLVEIPSTDSVIHVNISVKAGRRSGCNVFSVITSCYFAIILTHMLIIILAVAVVIFNVHFN